MQTGPALMDFSKEPASVLDSVPTRRMTARSAELFLARRLAERACDSSSLVIAYWDHHGNVKNDIKSKPKSRRPCAALIKDLKATRRAQGHAQVWAANSVRTPMGKATGATHHMKGFSMWLAGAASGGHQPPRDRTTSLSRTVDLVHVNDLHARSLPHGKSTRELRTVFKAAFPPHRRCRRSGKPILPEAAQFCAFRCLLATTGKAPNSKSKFQTVSASESSFWSLGLEFIGFNWN